MFELRGCKVSVRDRAEAVGLGKYYPMFLCAGLGMHHFDCGRTVSRGVEQALDVRSRTPPSGG